ncbi:hypothetical protein LCGC14_2668170 [marine sediment metagenome]|uniref:Uncharacterized protein n=1 Tax=marine sediment metagenome TaxID=412755 RepID=A0A0F8ZPW3_9ZZZZ
MDFEELIRKQPKTEMEQTLVQCIVSLSNHPNYSSTDMWTIYDKQVELAKVFGY